jgi:hypothetical protein
VFTPLTGWHGKLRQNAEGNRQHGLLTEVMHPAVRMA